MTSSRAFQSTPALRSTRALRGIAARSSVRIGASVPPYRPNGVRMASQMYAVSMVMLRISSHLYFIWNICGARAHNIHLAKLDYVTRSHAAATSLAENYAGLPQEWVLLGFIRSGELRQD